MHGHTLRPYCKPVSCFSEIERSQKNTVKNEKLAFSSGSHSLALSSRSPRCGGLAANTGISLIGGLVRSTPQDDAVGSDAPPPRPLGATCHVRLLQLVMKPV